MDELVEENTRLREQIKQLQIDSTDFTIPNSVGLAEELRRMKRGKSLEEMLKEEQNQYLNELADRVETFETAATFFDNEIEPTLRAFKNNPKHSNVLVAKLNTQDEQISTVKKENKSLRDQLKVAKESLFETKSPLEELKILKDNDALKDDKMAILESKIVTLKKELAVTKAHLSVFKEDLIETKQQARKLNK